MWFNESSKGNLLTGSKCPFCNRTAGHRVTCPQFKPNDDDTGASSRPKLYNAVAILWQRSQKINFITFTLPSRPGEKTYQRSPHCPETGDLAVSKKFSQVLEAIALRVKRSAPPNGIKKFSNVWISEAQEKRRDKFGGIGDIHFHLLTNQYIEIQWLQALWSSYFEDPENRNSVHIEQVPKGIQSIPAYLSKYLGKGSCRRIYSRRFGCSRDLSALAPIHVTHLPAHFKAITSKIVQQPNGYETALYYFSTGDVLEVYGAAMFDEKRWQGIRQGAQFTTAAIASRAFNRQIKQSKQRYAAETGLLPLGLSYST